MVNKEEKGFPDMDDIIFGNPPLQMLPMYGVTWNNHVSGFGPYQILMVVSGTVLLYSMKICLRRKKRRQSTDKLWIYFVCGAREHSYIKWSAEAVNLDMNPDRNKCLWCPLERAMQAFKYCVVQAVHIQLDGKVCTICHCRRWTYHFCGEETFSHSFVNHGLLFCPEPR